MRDDLLGQGLDQHHEPLVAGGGLDDGAERGLCGRRSRGWRRSAQRAVRREALAVFLVRRRRRRWSSCGGRSAWIHGQSPRCGARRTSPPQGLPQPRGPADRRLDLLSHSFNSCHRVGAGRPGTPPKIQYQRDSRRVPPTTRPDNSCHSSATRRPRSPGVTTPEPPDGPAWKQAIPLRWAEPSPRWAKPIPSEPNRALRARPDPSACADEPERASSVRKGAAPSGKGRPASNGPVSGIHQGRPITSRIRASAFSHSEAR